MKFLNTFDIHCSADQKIRPYYNNEAIEFFSVGLLTAHGYYYLLMKFIMTESKVQVLLHTMPSVSIRDKETARKEVGATQL